ncbi:MAG TPA: AgmX/PglI C-terminal domain-containing protein [Polyangiaceae bacterium]|jgi:hypothetical protein
MNSFGSVWANEGRFGTTRESAPEATGVDVVQVELSWRDARSSNVLGVKEVKAGETLALGERGDLMVPEEILCADRAEIVTFDGETATALLPPGGRMVLDGWPREERELEVCQGHVVEMYVGAFVVKLTRGRAGTKPVIAPLESLRRGGLGIFAGSAFVHIAAFAAIAFITPALGATEENPYDRDRILLMQALLDASAQHEKQAQPDDSPKDTGGDVNSGAPAKGLEGEAGKTDAPNRDARWAAKGNATPDTATLPREAVLREASTWGILGMLPSSAQDLNAPTVPWGTELNGSDDVNKVGHLFGGTIDDAFGTGGWGLSGPGEGGGGTASGIGLNGFGGLGHTGHCLGSNCGGIGVGYGKPGGGYKPHQIRVRESGGVNVNGRLPPEIIQRIVRQHFGQYTFCYQNGLKTNPSLTGRVTVKFAIGRDGAVQVAADGGSDIPDRAVTQCVVSAFSGLSFPPPEGGIVTVVYPLMFSPE